MTRSSIRLCFLIVEFLEFFLYFGDCPSSKVSCKYFSHSLWLFFSFMDTHSGRLAQAIANSRDQS